MRAAVVETIGPFDAIKVNDIEAPSPVPGEVLIPFGFLSPVWTLPMAGW